MSKRAAQQRNSRAKRAKSPLQFSFATAELFKSICKSLNSILVEANFDFTPEGLHMQKMDAAHVCLVELDMPASTFATYRCEQSTTFGVQVPHLATMMDVVKKDDQLAAAQRAKGTNRVLRFDFEGLWSSWHEIAEYTIEEESLGIPDTAYDTVVTMQSADFKNLVNKLSRIADVVEITTSENGVRWSAKGDDADSASAGVMMAVSEEDENDKNGITVTSRGRCRAQLSLSYLRRFAACAVVSKTMYIEISENIPVRFTFPIGDTGAVRLYLAPKIPDEDL